MPKNHPSSLSARPASKQQQQQQNHRPAPSTSGTVLLSASKTTAIQARQHSPGVKQAPSTSQAATKPASPAGAADPLIGQVIEKRFRLDRKIGSGSYGQVRIAVDLKSGKEVAVKLSRLGDCDQLLMEISVYKRMAGNEGFAKMHYFGSFRGWLTLVIEMLGRDLESIFVKCGRHFNHKTNVYIALQLISRFQDLHGFGIVYRDVKPENFMIGAHSNCIKVIDFGLSDYFEDGNHRHWRPGKTNELVGTVRYMSVNAHLGKRQSRRDDLESLGYVFLYFLKGRLPWSEVSLADFDEHNNRLCEMKRALDVRKALEGQPPVFADYLLYARALKYAEKPDYQRLRYRFRRYFKQTNTVDDGVYDWNG